MIRRNATHPPSLTDPVLEDVRLRIGHSRIARGLDELGYFVDVVWGCGDLHGEL